MQIRTVSVLGAGAWGTALANMAARAGHEVSLWGRDAAAMTALARTRENPHLPGVILDAGVTPLSDLGQAASADLLLAVLLVHFALLDQQMKSARKHLGWLAW